jgi:phage terminase small subunit
MALSPRQLRFVEEYLKDCNATAAYKRAGYRGQGRSAENAASRLLGNVGVQEAIAQKQAERAKRTQLSADEALKENWRLAHFDPRKLYREDGTLKTIPELDEDTAACIASLEVFEEFEGRGANRRQVGVTKKIKVFDKGAALDREFKHLGLYKPSEGDKPPAGSGNTNVNVNFISIDEFRQLPLDERIRILRSPGPLPLRD